MLKIWKNQFFFHTPRVQPGKEDSGHTAWSLTDREICCLFRGLGTANGEPLHAPQVLGRVCCLCQSLWLLLLQNMNILINSGPFLRHFQTEDWLALTFNIPCLLAGGEDGLHSLVALVRKKQVPCCHSLLAIAYYLLSPEGETEAQRERSSHFSLAAGRNRRGPTTRSVPHATPGCPPSLHFQEPLFTLLRSPCL